MTKYPAHLAKLIEAHGGKAQVERREKRSAPSALLPPSLFADRLVASRATGALAFYLPIKTVCEANARGHTLGKAGRVKRQRTLAAQVAATVAPPGSVKLPALVTMTRFSKGMLDKGDNLESACKHVRDGIADWLRVNDGDEASVVFACKQERAKGFGLLVEVRTVPGHVLEDIDLFNRLPQIYGRK